MPRLMDEIKLELEAWAAFHTPNLAIQPELLAKAHSFMVDSRKVTVTLPAAPRANNVDDEIIRLTSWREAEGERVPLQYDVSQVSLVVAIPGNFRLPESILTRSPNAFDLIQPNQQEKLNKLADDHYRIAERAMDVWSRTMRWKTGHWRLARPERLSIETGWGSTLKQTATGRRLWIRSKTIFVSFDDPMTPRQWSAAGSALLAGEIPPVFVDLLFDAEEHFERGDLRRALVDAAVAAETFMRTIVQRALPSGLGVRARDFFDKANIRPVMTKLFPEALAQLQLAPVGKSDLNLIHELLNARNDLVHIGETKDMSDTNCRKYLDAVHALLSSQIGSQ